jgi:cytochrome d ubiquinol oxidase subunit II
MLERLGVDPGVIPILAVVTLLLAGYFLRVKRNGWAFIMTAVSIATTTLTLFIILFPRVMVSSLNPAWSLTIYNASSSEYTLKIMTIIALVLVPVVLIYQGWTYYVFRKRLTTESELEY